MAGTMATPPERIAMSDHLSPSAAALARQGWLVSFGIEPTAPPKTQEEAQARLKDTYASTR